MNPKPEPPRIDPDSPQAYFSRELSWLAFARRVLAQVEDRDLPLLDRVKFAGIVGMLHDEFFMKRVSGLKRQIAKASGKLSIDGRTPKEELAACQTELSEQVRILQDLIVNDLRPTLVREKLPILNYDELDDEQQQVLRTYFRDAVLPILTPLAVDPEHPFPFISNLGLNLAAVFSSGPRKQRRFVRIKVPGNRPRWIPVPGTSGCTPLEQVIAANLDMIYPSAPPDEVHLFRVTRGAHGDSEQGMELQGPLDEPGSIIQQVTHELKARRFAGAVRLQVGDSMPKNLRKWLAEQLQLDPGDVHAENDLLGVKDLTQIQSTQRPDLQLPTHEPVVHPRLRGLPDRDWDAIFREIARADILLHHPYHCFDSSVLRFLESASHDPQVLAIKLTIYRTSSDSPIIRALGEAARRGKQVAVLVEITARFDEAPNIAWGEKLEEDGVHVAYGVERLKTHVKLALVVRQEGERLQQYAHVGTGNYHPGTAKIYEDLGVLTCDPDICDDVALVFNTLTGATPDGEHKQLLVAPRSMRKRFTDLIQREAEHAREGRPCGIDAKMNQLQDPQIIRELYAAGAAGVPITLNVRGLCCLRPGVPGLSENTRVFSVIGRFLEHSRLFRFANGGEPEYFLGSADWMKRNLSNRVETVMQVESPSLTKELDEIFAVYATDNSSAWDCGADGIYVRRTPAAGQPRRAAQEIFIRRARGEPEPAASEELITAPAAPGSARSDPPPDTTQ
jgi:polyphosphate kinase